MKKNISVNIFGTLYPIDEDAYELLLKYNENMRRYYANREGGDEIADDVEHRVAELLSELQAQGVQAITIEHVSDIIRRIGDPQEFDNVEDNSKDGANAYQNDSAGSYSEEGRSSKALFRDPDDKILGGVVSGICHYLGINDTLIPRFLVVILLFMSFSTLAIIYFVAWILIPEAKTPEDRLRMYGKPVTAKAITEELTKGVNSAKTFVQNPSNRDRAKGCLSGFLRLLMGLMAILALLILLALFIGLVFTAIAFIFGAGPFDDMEISHIAHNLHPWMLWGLFLSILCILLIPFFAIVRWLLKRPDSPDMSASSKIVLVAVWLLSLLLMIYTAFSIHMNVDKNIKENPKEYLSDECYSMLKKFKMQISTLSGCRSNIHTWTVTPDADEDLREKMIELEQNMDSDKDFLFDINRTENVNPGKYCIEGFVNANGNGAVMYAQMIGIDDKPVVYEITPYKESNILTMPIDSINRLPFINNEANPTDTVRAMQFRNLASNYEWDYARLDIDVEKPGTLKFGYANIPGISSDVNDVSYFRASQIKIRRLP